MIVETGKTVCTTGYLKSAFLWAQGLHMVTFDELRELVDYNANTGLFTWAVNRSNKTRAGSQAGSTRKDGYSVIEIYGRKYKSHRLAWLYCYGCFPKNCIDHINGNKSDNRISNLRDVTHSENLRNQKKPRSDNKSGFLGVCIHKRINGEIKFGAQIRTDGKPTFLGLFDTPNEAHMAYMQAKRIAHPITEQANERAERKGYGA